MLITESLIFFILKYFLQTFTGLKEGLILKWKLISFIKGVGKLFAVSIQLVTDERKAAPLSLSHWI